MNGLKRLAIVISAGVLGLSSADAAMQLGGVRSAQPRTNGFRGGVPMPPTAPVQPPGFREGRLGSPSRGFISTGSGFVGGSRGFVEGSGLRVDGRFDDDNFRLRFHLGADGFRRDWRHDDRHDDWRGHDWRHHDDWRHKHHRRPIVVYPPYFNYPLGYSFYDRGAYSFGGAYAGYYDPAMVWPGYTQPVAAPPQPEAGVPPLTSRELGDLGLYLDQPDAAIAAYRRHLDENPGDAAVMRLLGVAMIDHRNIRDGVAMVALAYRTDPNLARRPLPRDIVGESVGDLRTLVNRVSIFANNAGSPSAWLTMAVLAQAEGRLEVARRMAERARDAGLDATLADAVISAATP